ncbi:hypothetical protein JG687_00016477, partial [Phytophthora cactorum]
CVVVYLENKRSTSLLRLHFGVYSTGCLPLGPWRERAERVLQLNNRNGTIGLADHLGSWIVIGQQLQFGLSWDRPRENNRDMWSSVTSSVPVSNDRTRMVCIHFQVLYRRDSRSNACRR